MDMLQLSRDKGLSLKKQAFGATLRRNPDVLAVPDLVGELIGRLRIKTVTDFLAALEQYPSIFSQTLGWTAEDVHAAEEDLRQLLLSAQIDEPGIAPSTPQLRRRFGAAKRTRDGGRSR